MKYSFSHAVWQLKGVAPHVPMQGNIMETGRPFRGLTPWIPCDIPGGVSLALYRAKWLDYPYYAMNSLKCEWVEHRWWMYETTIERPALQGKHFKLLFHGVDYDALIYLNHQFLGEHVGMFEPFSFDITDTFITSDKLTLQVMIKSAPDEVAQVGRTSETTTQKSRFSYKWDFGTRLVNLGIWRDIEIVAQDDFVLTDVSVRSDVADDGTGLIQCGGAVENLSDGAAPLCVLARASLEGREVANALLTVEQGRFGGTLEIRDPALWQVNGRGAHPLYTVTLTLRNEEQELDCWQGFQGIRRLRFLQNESAPADALPYTYEINGTPIYIKGVNLTPLDHIYGDIPAERYEATVRAIAAMNVNLIRVWGGGIIEDERFYDLCDRYGILVWQEFIQSSSGIDNIPSKHPAFLKLLEKTARCAVARCANHTCLAAWSGGNELMDEKGAPAGYDDSNIAMLKAITDAMDSGRMMYPTSASGPNERQSAVPNTSHDVHGDWEYGGNPAHYPAQAEADHLFNSEFGCSGVSFPKTAWRVLPPEERRPADMRDNAMWRFRGDWWDTYQRDVEFFGPVDTLPVYTSVSQWIQAEAVRYTVEANRRRAFRNSGSVIWQFNEPWPNIANTCLYTYYDDPKMAYFWAKHAYGPFHVSLDYRRLDHVPGRNFSASIWISRDVCGEKIEASIVAEVLAMDGKVLHRQNWCGTLEPRHSSCCTILSFQVPNVEVFAVRLTAQGGGHSDSNCYFFSTHSQEIYRPYLELPAPTLSVRLLEEQGRARTYEIENTGTTAALHIHGFDRRDACIFLPEDDFFTLFPGEKCQIHCMLYPRFNYGFDEYPSASLQDGPEILFRAFPLDAPYAGGGRSMDE